MNKRAGLVLFSITIFLLSLEFASATADVAYIFRKNFKLDYNVIQVMNESGLSVELINADALPPFFSFAPYKMIFVGDENFQKNINKIPVGTKPTVVVNYYHAHDWGLTDTDGVSQLAATHPLSVQTDHSLTQVYTQAKYGSGSAKKGAIPYYYLDKDNKAENITSVAKTEPTSSGEMFGDVIAYGSPGDRLRNGKTLSAKLCFFGIVESDYWTPEAKQFFSDCVGFAASTCDDDSDCPSDVSSENFCYNGDIYQNLSLYTCQNPGQAISQCIDSVNMSLVEDCVYGCENATCIPVNCTTNADCDDSDSTTEDICINPATPQSYCTNDPITCSQNSDCGIDGFIGNKSCTGKNITQNYQTFICNNPGTALSFCSSSISSKVNKTCDFLCLNGACTTAVCYIDSDCDDLNPQTIDQCLNPGTVIAQCTHTPINCNSNSDCGFTGFTGTEFCTGKNITKNYQTSTCLNPGTMDSSCSVSVLPQFLSSCQYVCLNGACIRCNSNADCDDSNANTNDICNNPGQASSHCQNNPIPQENILCTKDSDCGSNQTIAGPFCSLSNVDYLVRTWHCNNPNTTSSFCSSEVVQIVNKTCANYCFSGNCADIECFTHSDCNDNNSSTLDICNNPGTPSSYCTNNPIEIICSSDADCGTSGFLPGNICVGKNLTQLYETYTCYAPGTPQSFCSSSISQLTVQSCSFLCSAGACINPPICGNSLVEYGEECDDGNIINGDGCDSNCNIEPNIVCYYDSDCGTNSFVGSPYCVGKNLTRDYRTFQCLFAGTPLSSCTHSDMPIKQQICSYSCSAGACINPPITCYSDADCDDSNHLTIDQCVYPGTPSSYCTHTPINCLFDIDCGITGLIGPLYCIGNNVTQNYQTAICQNPGLPSSHCLITISQYFFMSCPSTCDNGNCITPPPSCTNDCSASGITQCSSATTYQICGNYDSDSCLEWSLNNQCSLGQTCSGGVCSTPTPSCTDECSSSGVKQCSSTTAYQTCGNYDQDSCLEWSSSSSCSAGQTCSGAGNCITPPPSCTNDCSASGITQCSSATTYQICGNYDSDSCLEWSLNNQCSLGQTCQSGTCSTPSCTNDCSIGQRICAGASGYKICGNFDSDSCLDWSLINQCGIGQTCSGAGNCG